VGLAGLLTQRTTARAASSSEIVVQVETAAIGALGDGHHPATGQLGAHGVGGIGVAGARTVSRPGVRKRRNQAVVATNLLGSHTGGDVGGVDVDAEAAVDPAGRRLAQDGRTDRRRVAALGPRRTESGDDGLGRWVAGGADGQVDHAAGVTLSAVGHGREAAVGIGRGDETAGPGGHPRRRGRASGRGWAGHEARNCGIGPAGLVEDDMDDGGPLAVGFVDHLSFAVNGGQDVTAVEGDEQLDHAVGHSEVDTEGVDELVDTETGPGRDDDGPRMIFGHPLGPTAAVGFVHDQELGDVPGADLLEDEPDGVDLGLGFGSRAVDHMEEELRLSDLVEGGTEGLDQLVRKLADESDGVGDENGLTPRESQAAGPGIEGREGSALDQDTGIGQAVEQGGLAGVGVAHQGHRAVTAPDTGATLGPTGGRDLAEVDLESGHAAEEAAAVHLELGLPRPRVPIPPACWENSRPRPRKRGRR
jgi:hypothetical protein